MSHDEKRWSVSDSLDLYQVRGWGTPYFGINDAGHVVVQPDPTKDRVVDLYEISRDLVARGLQMPLLIRFPEILGDRIRLLNESFATAIANYDYQSRYRGVFPIKVNQQRHVVEGIVESGEPWQYGLEAGSKPELLIALAELDRRDGLIICNGYKDRAYIETALIAQKFDNTVVIVVERPDEIRTVLEASERLGIRPNLGVRAKLSRRGMGRWATSAGDGAKFGLTSTQIVAAVEALREREMLDCMRLLHFHIGSQVSSIRPWKAALREASQIYVELVRLGCRMGFLDVGGGLAVDYDGSRSDFRASMNYGVQEYANDVVAGIADVCNEADVEHPTIVSESGRAVVAHQSVLVFDAVAESHESRGIPSEPADDAHRVLLELWGVFDSISSNNIQESWHDAQAALQEARSLFGFGYLSLTELADAETLYWACCARIHEKTADATRLPDELESLDEHLGSIYYCNFSLFQSAPDIWALDQLFPIMPVHRLDERPTQKAKLADLTCDSDGLVRSFIDVDGEKSALDVHEVTEDEPYLLGMFLTGAYQEILGDLHNLFGDTNAVHIRTTPSGYAVSDVIKGDTVSEVLHYLQYDAERMVEKVRRQAERAHGEGDMTVKQLRMFMKHYENSLGAYTYLDDGEH